MKCVILFFNCIFLVFITLSATSPVGDTTTPSTPNTATERERRQVKPDNNAAQPELKTLGMGGQLMGRQGGQLLPFGAGNAQPNRYGGGLMFGAYPNVGFQGVPIAGPVVNMPGFGYNNPVAGNYIGGGMPYGVNPTDMFGNVVYNSFLPATASIPQNVAALPNAQNLDNVVNMANYQGIAGAVGAPVPAQLNSLQLQAQASQLQPQVAPYAMMSGYYPSYQGYGPTYPAYQPL